MTAKEKRLQKAMATLRKQHVGVKELYLYHSLLCHRDEMRKCASPHLQYTITEWLNDIAECAMEDRKSTAEDVVSDINDMIKMHLELKWEE
jgi:hypothetical protein